jgi:hypothetical protein
MGSYNPAHNSGMRHQEMGGMPDYSVPQQHFGHGAHQIYSDSSKMNSPNKAELLY